MPSRGRSLNRPNIFKSISKYFVTYKLTILRHKFLRSLDQTIFSVTVILMEVRVNYASEKSGESSIDELLLVLALHESFQRVFCAFIIAK